jgi:signal-induced proliferation-associated 1 like protein 3
MLPLEPLPPDEPEPMVPLPEVPLEPDEPLVPMLPLPEVPLAPDEPVPLPLLDEPLVPPELDPPVALPELPEPVEPLLLEPELLCFFDCFFLLDFWVDDEPPEVWSDCELALLPPVDDELPLVCAWAAPHIARATEAPSRPFSNLFIFMSLS